MTFCHCVVPENIHTTPTEGIGNFREGGVSKPQKFKAMYKAKLEFPGVGGKRANLFCGGGYGFFLELHLVDHLPYSRDMYVSSSCDTVRRKQMLVTTGE